MLLRGRGEPDSLPFIRNVCYNKRAFRVFFESEIITEIITEAFFPRRDRLSQIRIFFPRVRVDIPTRLFFVTYFRFGHRSFSLSLLLFYFFFYLLSSIITMKVMENNLKIYSEKFYSILENSILFSRIVFLRGEDNPSVVALITVRKKQITLVSLVLPFGREHGFKGDKHLEVR